jgi:uncharacterized repeat protein (TIGR01451 family)
VKRPAAPALLLCLLLVVPLAAVATARAQGGALSEEPIVASTVEATSDLKLTQTDTPDPVTEGANVRYRLTIKNNGPDPANGVTVDDFIDGGTILTASGGTAWACSRTSFSATCTLKASQSPLLRGQTAPVIDVVARADGGSESTVAVAAFTMSNFATAYSSSFDPVESNSSETEFTTVEEAGGGEVTGFIGPNGGKITTNTGAGATPSDNTYGELIVPPGPGGVFTLIEDPDGLAVCPALGDDCLGSAVDVRPAPGYTNPQSPLRFNLVYDKTVLPSGRAIVLVEKLGVDRPVPGCLSPGVASPSPCVTVQERIGGGDLRIGILLLSPDPKFQGLFRR